MIAATLNSGGNDGGFRTEPGEHLAIVFQERGREGGRQLESQEDIAYSLMAPNGGGRRQENCVAFQPKYYADRELQGGKPSELAPTITSAQAERSDGEIAVAYQCHGSNVGPMGTLRSGNGNESGGVPFLFAQNQRDEVRTMEVAGALAAEPGMKQQSYVHQEMAVRRLTPRECERLQGFPDDWTRYDADGNEISDSARYRMCGNAVCVPVACWIGRRIMAARRGGVGDRVD